MDILNDVKITKLNATQSAAASDFNGASVDMQNWDGVLFLSSLGTANAANGIKAQQSSDDGASDTFADLASSQQLSDGTQTDLALDIVRPRERYVRPVIVRGSSSTVESIWAVQYRGRKGPADNSTTALASKALSSPAEGTA